VIAVVQPDAQNLVRAREWSAESAVTDALHFSRCNAIRDDLRERREFSRCEKRLVEISNNVRQIDKLVFANEHSRNFSTYGAQSNQFHYFLFSC
jgi:hypothetical protein